MSEENVKWFLYGMLAVLGVEFLFYMLVLIVWGKEMRILLLTIGLLILFFKSAITLAIIDVITGTQWFSWINSLYALILQVLWMRTKDD